MVSSLKQQKRRALLAFFRKFESFLFFGAAWFQE